MANDRGLVALAERLNALYALGHIAFPCGEDTEREAAAILAERGVFLPDGHSGCDMDLAYEAGKEDGTAEQEAEIKQLQAALANEHRAQFAMRHNPGACKTCDLLPPNAVLAPEESKSRHRGPGLEDLYEMNHR